MDLGEDGTIHLDPWGGQQEARGNTKGAEFYVENIFEELDSPREWFADFEGLHSENKGEKKIYYYPNATGPPPTTVVVPRLATLLSIEGDQTLDLAQGLKEGSVQNIKLQGVTFTHSLTTFLDEYEVPSGGDWSMHRGGSVFAQGVSGLVVEGCHFNRLGGNALTLSEYAYESKILDSEFSWIGDSGISQLGSVVFDRTGNMSSNSTDLMDATDGRHPYGTEVNACLFREIGIYGKQVPAIAIRVCLRHSNHLALLMQVSAFASALAFGTSINGSIFFNGPRAGSGLNWSLWSCSRSLIPRMAGSTGMTEWEVEMQSRQTYCGTGSERHLIMAISTLGM